MHGKTDRDTPGQQSTDVISSDALLQHSTTADGIGSPNAQCPRGGGDPTRKCAPQLP